MMLCIYSEQTYFGKGKDVRRCVIQADTTPATFPKTGVGVIELSDTAKIAPGSMIHCVDTGKNYFLSTDGTEWLEDGGNA